MSHSTVHHAVAVRLTPEPGAGRLAVVSGSAFLLLAGITVAESLLDRVILALLVLLISLLIVG